MYVPPPLICFRCGVLGHHRSSCEKEQICRLCAEPQHDNECTKVKCCLCGGEHRTTAKLCTVYAEEYEVKKAMVTQHINYFEAKRQVRKTQSGTYAKKTMNAPIDPTEMDKLTALIELMSKRIQVLENLLVRNSSASQALKKDGNPTPLEHVPLDCSGPNGACQEGTNREEDSVKRKLNRKKTPTNKLQDFTKPKKR